jgi:rhamnosyltransferase
MGSNVAIVMATYNGAAHVEEQIRSLQAQDRSDWRLYVRDDGSSDATPALVAQLAEGDPRITVLESRARLGVIGNFGALLSHAHRMGADYVFPSDQDDVWQPGKLSGALAVMAALEAEHGRDAPLLVHSDLAVVDDRLRPLHPSFLRYQGIANEEADPLEVLLVQNYVTGCASLLNRPLLDLGLPIPESCIMHDWWLAQCAAARGAIGFIPAPTILYRQHGANQIGASGALGNLNVLHARGRKRFVRSWNTAVQTVAQARALHHRLQERGGASPEALALVDAYAGIDATSPARRLRTLHRYGIRRQRPLGTALLYVRVALLGLAADGAPRPKPAA